VNDPLFNLKLKTQLKPWYWRSLPLAGRTGAEVFAALFRRDATPAVATLLESPYPTPPDQPQMARYSICAGTPRLVNGCPQMWTPPLGEVLPFLQQLLRGARGSECVAGVPPVVATRVEGRGARGSSSAPISLPFTGGWLGWLGYDLAWEIERLPHLKSDPLPFPVAFWYEPECFAVLDHWDQILWLAASAPNQLDSLQKHLEQSPLAPRRELLQRGEPPQRTRSPSPLAPRPSPLAPHFLTSQEDYETSVRRAKKYIQTGDIFQANLSLRFEAYTAADSWAIYQALQQINPSPFASYWQTPWGAVISCSPERLVQLQSRQAQTRPIAGTRSRGTTSEQDQQLAQDLITNTKERAEHIMLVDLERNDLGRVCEWGSVTVNELLTIERYSHVMHLVSNITGTLRPNYNAVDLIRAMFPGGTITGCPKVRCMEIIEELEPVRRSLFYGSCGYLDWRGNLDLNILIRTLLFSRQDSVTFSSYLELSTGGFNPNIELPNKILAKPAPTGSSLNIVWGQVGAGIVADSDPEREWYESLHKAQAQLTALKNSFEV